jgi:hypothetical protein
MIFDYAILAFMGGLFVGLFVMGNSEIKKVINETLKNPRNGEYSRKNITGFSCFAVSVIYCMYALVHDKAIQEFVIAIFMSASMACLGISSWEKVNISKPTAPQPDLPAEGT